MIYGDLPEDLGELSLPTTEMMFWMYCPISVPGKGWFLPDTLIQFTPLLHAVWLRDPERCRDEYVYLTAKTLWVTPSNPGNRPGWHSDGFGTNDINYIWYDRAPTEFLNAGQFDLSDDCADAMHEMGEQARHPSDVATFPNRRLLRLTPSCIHRVAPVFEPGMRTFLKVSISPDRYNLEGNAINHRLPEVWDLVPRAPERNHPATPALVRRIFGARTR